MNGKTVLSIIVLIVFFSCATQNEENKEFATIQYKNKRDKVKVAEVEVLVKGEVSLYLKTFFQTSMNPNTGAMTQTNKSTYYIKKKDEPYAVFYVAKGYIPPQSFNNVVAEFFKDCPQLIQKVENRVYKKKHFMEIVEYYNSQCGK